MAAKINPLVVIVGMTGSGKSALGLEIARKYDGEIVCADSRTVYKGMDIGTAKPSEAERREIPHHLLDVVSPDEPFSAAEFKRRALIWVDDITIRGKLPIMVGGTGLYIDGVIFDFAFLPPVPAEDREHLQRLSVDELQQKIADLGLELPENSRNPRHLIRQIETNGAVAVKKGIRENTLVLGIDITKEELSGRLKRRTQQMLRGGLEAEVKGLAERYGWDAPGLSAVGYREWQDYFENDKSISEVEQEIVSNSMHYAKRQRTWFRRNPDIDWIKNSSDAVQRVQSFLQQQR